MKLHLRVTSGKATGREATLQPPGGMLGRDPACNLVVEHDSVSRSHAELCWQQGRWLLYQRSGRGSTVADGKSVNKEPVPLQSRGTIQLGTEFLEYWHEEPRPASPPAEVPLRAEGHSMPAVPLTVRPGLSMPMQATLSQLERLSAVNEAPTVILPRRPPAGASSPPLSSRSYDLPAQKSASLPRAASDFAARPGVPLADPPVTIVNPLRARPGVPPPPPRFALPVETPVTQVNPQVRRPAQPPDSGREALSEAKNSAAGVPLAQHPRDDLLVPTLAEKKRLEGEVARLETDVARLKKENEILKDARAALEAQLKLSRDAGPREGLPAASNSGREPALRQQVMQLVQPFSAALEQAIEALSEGRADQARGLLREASYGLGELLDLLRGA